jgi:cytochrome P450
MSDPYYNGTIPEHVPPALVNDFNLFDPAEEGRDLFQSVRGLHERKLPDIFWSRNNGGHWVALRGEAIAEIARDPGIFSSKRMLVPDDQNFQTPFFVPLMSDPPEHAGYRSIVAPLFAPKRIAALETGVRELTASLIEQIRVKGGCEFMSEFALQMPIIVFLKLLDLPLEDREQLLDIASRVVRPPPEGERRDDAMQQMFDYLRPILADRVANPGPDVISQLVTGLHNGRPLGDDEMLGLAATLLSGGLDTVAASLGFFVRYLADNPQARAALIADPTKINAAIEELIRRYPPTTHGRIVTKDVRFRGVDMRSGDHIVWMAGMFNFDERQFEKPMDVDFDRKRAPHISFGNGIHFCVGSFLARMELGVFLAEWLTKVPDFHVKPGATIKYRPGINIAYDDLPLEWET